MQAGSAAGTGRGGGKGQRQEEGEAVRASLIATEAPTVRLAGTSYGQQQSALERAGQLERRGTSAEAARR